MIVVSDTTPLISLLKIDRIDLYEGAYFSNGSANINNGILKNGNVGLNGGTVKAGTGSFLSFTNCKLHKNRASAYGGGISNSGNTTLGSSIVFDNTASAETDIANDICKPL